MTALAALVLANSAPANLTFVPASIDSSGVAKWFTNQSVYDAKNSATMQVTLPKNGSPVARVKLRVVCPVMDTVDTTIKAGEAYANVEMVLPKISSELQRLDLRALIVSMLEHAAVTAAVTNFESQY